jgi:hypothetical protein
MTLNASERAVLTDLIGAVRTLANQVLIVHLQLGAVRAILARKGTVTRLEVDATLNTLDAASVTGELLSDRPSIDETFANLLRRLQEADNSSSAL